jgi:hypothetical protein
MRWQSHNGTTPIEGVPSVAVKREQGWGARFDDASHVRAIIILALIQQLSFW